jgi:DNA-binding protein
MSDETNIFIGNKPPMMYVTAMITAFNNEGVDRLVLKARGRAISRAVDVAEIARRRFLNDIETSKIDIGTEQMPTQDGGTRGVSTIAITIEKTGTAESPKVVEEPSEIPKAVEEPSGPSFEVSEIKGVGKATEEKLRKAGYDSVESIVSVDPETLAEKAGISTKVATKLIESAKALKT